MNWCTDIRDKPQRHPGGQQYATRPLPMKNWLRSRKGLWNRVAFVLTARLQCFKSFVFRIVSTRKTGQSTWWYPSMMHRTRVALLQMENGHNLGVIKHRWIFIFHALRRLDHVGQGNRDWMHWPSRRNDSKCGCWFFFFRTLLTWLAIQNFDYYKLACRWWVEREIFCRNILQLVNRLGRGSLSVTLHWSTRFWMQFLLPSSYWSTFVSHRKTKRVDCTVV